jgi:antitoxin (DNA-binding transcriptional repressor) of toxin-antitoxin stability system
MLEVDITHTSVTIDQLLNQVEAVEEATLMRHGKPIVRLLGTTRTPQPLTSRKELRAAQPQAAFSTIETLQNLRQEARY